MEFREWEPAYEAIRADFGYDREMDRHGRDVLEELVPGFDLGRLDGLADATVAIVGAGPSLPSGLEEVRSAEYVIAASLAVPVLRRADVSVDLMVTDLDKTPATARALTEAGTPVAVHAHGDNIPLLREQVPTFDGRHVLPTTQVEPVAPVQNFGGFTDGDRGAFIADELGAATLRFHGWDFDDQGVSEEKQRKLWWAARLLRWLERRRGESFSVLDGYRHRLRLSWME